MLAVSLPDAVALLVAFALWQGFAYLMDHSRWSRSTLTTAVNEERLVWMKRAVDRDNRIVDSSLIGNLMRSVAFFASATIIILGGVAAAMGAVDRNYDTVQAMPFMPPISKGMFEAKLALLGLIFIYSFLKFTWSLRQFNYCCIVLGGAPPPDAAEPEKLAFAKRAARISELGARSFNQGLRGHYFALASLGWFIHPLAFVAAAVAVFFVLWRREFHSRTRRALRGI